MRYNENDMAQQANDASKDVRQLVTAECHLPPKRNNFGFFTTKIYKF